MDLEATFLPPRHSPRPLPRLPGAVHLWAFSHGQPHLGIFPKVHSGTAIRLSGSPAQVLWWQVAVLITVNSGYGQISREIGCLLVVLQWCIVYGINAPNGQGCQLIFITLSWLSCSGSTASSMVTGNAGLCMSCMPWDVQMWPGPQQARDIDAGERGLLQEPPWIFVLGFWGNFTHPWRSERLWGKGEQSWVASKGVGKEVISGKPGIQEKSCHLPVDCRHCVVFTSVPLQPSERGHFQGHCAFKGTFSPVPLLSKESGQALLNLSVVLHEEK